MSVHNTYLQQRLLDLTVRVAKARAVVTNVLRRLDAILAELHDATIIAKLPLDQPPDDFRPHPDDDAIQARLDIVLRDDTTPPADEGTPAPRPTHHRLGV